MLKRICLTGCNKVILLFLGIIILSSCQKDDEPPFSIVPKISLVSVSHDTIIEYVDKLIISISYQDGDGDLGFPDPDDYAIFIRDARLERFDGFYLGPITPPGVSVPIQGKLDIEFPPLFLFGTREEESTRFFIKMIDRAGHESNMLETGTVIIKRAS